MSTPTPGPASSPASPQAAASPQTTTAASPQSAAAQQTAPAGAPAPAAPRQTRGAGAGDGVSRTPRLLRLARGAAAAAALLTGVVATGTFSTDGINSTPNVIADQWAAAEQAGVDMAQADLLAAERVIGEDPADAQALEAYDEVLRAVGSDLSRMADGSGQAAGDWSTFVTGVERAGAADAPGQAYADASRSARDATARVDDVAAQHAQDLLTGSRSMLTTVVGTLGVLVLLGVMVWLALRTRRILNVPLALATVITGGLAWLSVNPTALPLNYDMHVEETQASTTALQQVFQARQAQLAAAAGIDTDWETQADATTDAVEALGDADLEDDWQQVRDAGVGDGAVQDSADAYDRVTESLSAQVSDDLSNVDPDVSSPAVLTAAGALLLGLLGAGLAWAGVTQRLRDYR
ncbi:putative secreted protein [Serinicoccus hydrothermalis]|uniref:Putative secreted protein n=1 Tax=Serinicoccus hydrothermalis TaxID=1758689 RepID=A0A1B1NA58_9MICO|nr:hypothetical protein [Serinicoccus hydrothermalis]ANS78317.1 putative secreted protein [Serinicoccus hydrothermalis]